MARPNSYSKTQIILHWLILLAVLFQYFAHESIAGLWRDRMSGAIPNVPTPDLHVAVGLVIFLLMVWRVWLRISHGAPAPSAKESAAGRILAQSVQGLIYLAILVLPLSGALGWFLGLGSAAAVHGVITKILLALIALHVAGALFQHFWLKSDALTKMLGRA